ncbi:hypothetical protein SNEBB_008645 [Seison nebaliae]|nr:hypothetical protein SNEBB_008645 [Seison nebaliae]
MGNQPTRKDIKLVGGNIGLNGVDQKSILQDRSSLETGECPLTSQSMNNLKTIPRSTSEYQFVQTYNPLIWFNDNDDKSTESLRQIKRRHCSSTIPSRNHSSDVSSGIGSTTLISQPNDDTVNMKKVDYRNTLLELCSCARRMPISNNDYIYFHPPIRSSSASKSRRHNSKKNKYQTNSTRHITWLDEAGDTIIESSFLAKNKSVPVKRKKYNDIDIYTSDIHLCCSSKRNLANSQLTRKPDASITTSNDNDKSNISERNHHHYHQHHRQNELDDIYPNVYQQQKVLQPQEHYSQQDDDPQLFSANDIDEMEDDNMMSRRLIENIEKNGKLQISDDSLPSNRYCETFSHHQSKTMNNLCEPIKKVSFSYKDAAPVTKCLLNSNAGNYQHSRTVSQPPRHYCSTTLNEHSSKESLMKDTAMEKYLMNAINEKKVIFTQLSPHLNNNESINSKLDEISNDSLDNLSNSQSNDHKNNDYCESKKMSNRQNIPMENKPFENNLSEQNRRLLEKYNSLLHSMEEKQINCRYSSSTSSLDQLHNDVYNLWNYLHRNGLLSDNNDVDSYDDDQRKIIIDDMESHNDDNSKHQFAICEYERIVSQDDGEVDNDIIGEDTMNEHSSDEGKDEDIKKDDSINKQSSEDGMSKGERHSTQQETTLEEKHLSNISNDSSVTELKSIIIDHNELNE